MGFSFGKIFLGPATLPPHAREELTKNDTIPVIVEELSGSIVCRNFRSKHKRTNYQKSMTRASLLITDQHIFCFGGRGRRLVGMPFNDPRTSQMEFSTSKDNLLVIQADVSLTNPNASGQWELRLSTPRAGELCDLIRNNLRRARHG
mmetsp:Transcript_27168/g.41115  ORF Transcript_27168/g.41115 Transcript_27168/m.41115 type:complete len:147 (-) Transcript_27168:25-465(-)